MSWTLADIERLQSTGKIKGHKVIGGGCSVSAKPDEKPNNRAAKPKKIHEQLEFIKLTLSNAGIEFTEEYRFCERRWRFDIAILSMKVAIEYEGLAYHKTGHTESDRYSKNCDKYNRAQLMGWKVLRYTFLNYKYFENDLQTFLNNKK